MERLEVRINPNLKSKLEEKAQELQTSVSEIVREAIELYIALAEAGIPIELIKKALKSSEEARYLLELVKEYGELVYSNFDIIYGEAEVLLLELFEGPPRRELYLVVPKTIPVIIHRWGREGERAVDEVYVFTREGWKRVEVQ